MFNNHNLPKSLINEVSNLLGNTNADFELPQVLQDVVAEAARDYLMCPTQEDRKAIVEWHAEQVIDTDELEQNVLVNFERAVAHAAASGVVAEDKDKKPATERIADIVAKKEAKAAGPKKPLAKSTRGMGLSTTERIAHIVARKAEREKQMQTNSVDHSHLLDVLSSLNEDEFNAYIDILSESEVAALEQIINEAEEYHKGPDGVLMVTVNGKTMTAQEYHKAERMADSVRGRVRRGNQSAAKHNFTVSKIKNYLGKK